MKFDINANTTVLWYFSAHVSSLAFDPGVSCSSANEKRCTENSRDLN